LTNLKISLTKAAIDVEDVQAMEKAVRRCAIAQGEITSAFETSFASYLGAAGGVATNSGASALILALRTLDIGSGHEVIIPSYALMHLRPLSSFWGVAQLGLAEE
jgi:dTDP-4-amino-4,6-dideoxygalactose transaminase